MTNLLRRGDENAVKIVVVGYESEKNCRSYEEDDNHSFSEYLSLLKSADAEEAKKRHYVIIKTISNRLT
jgi:hypothetical protein